MFRMQGFLFDAVLLAGGRASRLGGVDKTAFTVGGRSLLDLALEAAQDATATAVVGLRDGTAPPPGAVLVREDPPWSGPVAALAAGLRSLDGTSPRTLVLACDLPRAPAAVRALLEGALLEGAPLEGASAEAGRVGTGSAAGTPFGAVALDESGRRQPLLALYDTALLHRRLDELEAGTEPGGLVGLSFRRLLAGLPVLEVPLSAGLSADVDTADDARRLGVSGAAGAAAG